MADVFYGDAEIRFVIPGQDEPMTRVAAWQGELETVLTECFVKDLAGASPGPEDLTHAEASSSAIDFIGATGGDVEVTIPALGPKKAWWIRDRSTGGVVTVIVDGGTGTELSKNLWIYMQSVTTSFNHAAGWLSYTETPAIVYETNWGASSGRTPRVWKEDSGIIRAGGVVKIDGAVEKGVANPAANEHMLTLPATFRPEIKAAYVCPVNSDLTTACEQLYGPQMFNWGLHAATVYAAGGSDRSLKTYGRNVPALNGTVRTPWLHRGAAVISHSVRFEVTVENVAGDIILQTYGNGGSVFETTIAIDGLGFYQAYELQDPPTDLIAADQPIALYMHTDNGEFEGTLLRTLGLCEVVTYSIAGERRTTTVEIDTDGAMYLNGPLPLADETIDLSGIEFQVGN